MEDNERDAFDRELITVGAVWGFGGGWGSYAAYRQDWLSVAIVVLALIAYLIYRHIRIERSLGIRD